jgi:hypothetical protein
VNQSFDGLELLSQRPDKQVLEETESKLRKRVKNQGLETIGSEDTGIQFSKVSHQIENEKDLIRYLDHSTGRQPVDLVVYASSQRGTKEIEEQAEAHISLDSQGFLDVYSSLEQDQGVKTACFSISGYGEDLSEAYESTIPMISFILDGEDEAGLTVSYRDGGTVETIWSDSEETFRDVYDSLFGLGLDYEGATIEGEKDSAWMIADYGFADLDETR